MHFMMLKHALFYVLINCLIDLTSCGSYSLVQSFHFFSLFQTQQQLVQNQIQKELKITNNEKYII